MVGRALAAQARAQGRNVVALTSADWDITDATAAERFITPGDVVEIGRASCRERV